MGLYRRVKIKVRSVCLKSRLSHKKNVTIEGKLAVDDYSSIFVVGDARLYIGSLFMNSYSSITARYDISIGHNVMFGENVHVYDHNHRFNRPSKSFSEQGYVNKSVSIGNNCWIGSGVTILAGTVIGNNCVIGANCVINGVIPDDSIVRCDKNLVIEKIKYHE